MKKRRSTSDERSVAKVVPSPLDLAELSLFELLEHFSNDVARVELALDCYHRGREAFPGIEWNRVDFTRMCFQHWNGRSLRELEESLGALARAEEYLVRACIARAPGAAETLDKAYLAKVNARVRKICRSRDLADDAAQVLWEKLLLAREPKLATYESRGKLANWLGVVASRVALDVSRQRIRTSRNQAPLEENAASGDLGPEADYGARQLLDILRRFIHEALLRLPEHLRFVLELSLSGLSIDRIGETLATHRSTSARRLVAARSMVEADVRTALAKEMGLGASDIPRLPRVRDRARDSSTPLFDFAISECWEFSFAP